MMPVTGLILQSKTDYKVKPSSGFRQEPIPIFAQCQNNKRFCIEIKVKTYVMNYGYQIIHLLQISMLKIITCTKFCHLV